MAGEGADELELAGLEGSEHHGSGRAGHGVCRHELCVVVTAAGSLVAGPAALELDMVGQKPGDLDVVLRVTVVQERQPHTLAKPDLDDVRVESPVSTLYRLQGDFNDVAIHGVVVVVKDYVSVVTVVVVILMDGGLGTVVSIGVLVVHSGFGTVGVVMLVDMAVAICQDEVRAHAPSGPGSSTNAAESWLPQAAASNVAPSSRAATTTSPYPFFIVTLLSLTSFILCDKNHT